MPDTHLYEEMGGAEGVDAAISDFYGRVFEDPVLRGFFEGVDVEKLIAMQREFFAAALGGPVKYSGMTLRDAHSSHSIGRQHLSRFTDHLLTTLEDRGVAKSAAVSIVSQVALYSEDILGEVAEDG